MTELAVPATPVRPTVLSGVLAVASSAVLASLLCLGVAAVAHAAGASPQFQALTPAVFVPFIVLGAIGGAVGWSIIRRRARDAAELLRWLVPAVFVVSLIPDVLVGVTRALPGSSWPGVLGLMSMHLVVTVCVVAAYRIFLPVGRVGRTGSIAAR